jgi:hypothetical protein
MRDPVKESEYIFPSAFTESLNAEEALQSVEIRLPSQDPDTLHNSLQYHAHVLKQTSASYSEFENVLYCIHDTGAPCEARRELVPRLISMLLMLELTPAQNA